MSIIFDFTQEWNKLKLCKMYTDSTVTKWKFALGLSRKEDNVKFKSHRNLGYDFFFLGYIISKVIIVSDKWITIVDYIGY